MPLGHQQNKDNKIVATYADQSFIKLLGSGNSVAQGSVEDSE